MTKAEIRKHIQDHYDYMFGIDIDNYSKQNMELILKEFEVAAKEGRLQTIGANEKFNRAQ